MADKGIYTLSQIPLEEVKRFPTGFDALDKAYGTTIREQNGRAIQELSGLPVGAVSLWSGAGGVGKSRVAVAVSSAMNAVGFRILYIQTEVGPSQFKQWTADNHIPNPDEFLLGDITTIEAHLSAIRNVRPHLVVVDSLNMISGHQSPTVIRQVVEGYKAAAKEQQCHVIVIGHLNKAGGVKGNNDITYLTDINCMLTPLVDSLSKEQVAILDHSAADHRSMFVMKFDKNRYGSCHVAGHKVRVTFKHVVEGIEYVESNWGSATPPPIPMFDDDDDDF